MKSSWNVLRPSGNNDPVRTVEVIDAESEEIGHVILLASGPVGREGCIKGFSVILASCRECE